MNIESIVEISIPHLLRSINGVTIIESLLGI